RNAILKLLVAEKSARNTIKAENTTSIKDKISRALGILKYSFQLETVEALSSISLVKLGVELEWIKNISLLELNKIFFTCRRAHLSYSLKEKIPAEEVSARRAEFLKEMVKAATLEV